MNKGLTLRNVCILRAGNPLIEVDHHIAPGDVLTVMGPSGVGKSTLLAFITGTLPSVFKGMGQVVLDGEDITGLPPHRRQIGILFQDDLLFPHMSVGANLAFGMPSGGGRAARRVAIEDALKDVDLDGYADRDPATLSGGQKARVALARMLLSQPRALLLDEAFSRLDAELRAQVRDLVFRTAKSQQLPVLMVTHDAEDAAAAGGALVKLEALST
ncbi:ATP-binding cassette domain-containing protein [Pseudooctadecabacter jejudonensis]|uniref:Spermidine/putrescine import ATP-binding protein PotA n=1 Tax=Pseudooctadecabacter jejudonensis TaxID=1391910 RepID=A0A1Y5S529_9RHOB|nr:ATP-binding cassette domain-containing protein [Pseudooctadecabacter jejudonensis]SLN32315.1 Spermidine/putrescine import ATP-binding protein PotA [Pseudooctadecabacter jejudonensis]